VPLPSSLREPLGRLETGQFGGARRAGKPSAARRAETLEAQIVGCWEEQVVRQFRELWGEELAVPVAARRDAASRPHHQHRLPLAECFASEGLRTLVIDADHQCLSSELLLGEVRLLKAERS
jgi:hypothetical protein